MIIARLDLTQEALSKYVICADSRNSFGSETSRIDLRTVPTPGSFSNVNGRLHHAAMAHHELVP
jgi:hypothetical protein